ncbi:MAG: site-specific DNA-methyltransferase [Anaerolineae bacterium]|nr:site-specific DNA-methyltransferase [Anaerolineae bacterium]
MEQIGLGDQHITRISAEFWTARQRQANPLHEVAYRACFKPQLPRFFIERLTRPGDVVYDPFSGRGTTSIEAALLGRRVIANDINPLSRILTEARLSPPDLDQLQARKDAIVQHKVEWAAQFPMFYHPQTEAELHRLRGYLTERQAKGETDAIDNWIRMVATNRLTGHSPGFFSVYTLPPNQAVSAERQIKINQKRQQTPPYRDTWALILRKSKALVGKLSQTERVKLHDAAQDAIFLNCDAAATRAIPPNSVQLTVTSPPFLDVVQYAADNWLRCWFNGIDAQTVGQRITMARSLGEWREVMGRVFAELYRITRPGGWVAFEVGEVRNRSVRLDEHVVPLGLAAGFTCVGILVNQQVFTKTSNIWGVYNNTAGTNSNRIVVFCKDG